MEVKKLVQSYATTPVRNARVDGVSRLVEQVYLGKLEDLIANRRSELRPRAVRTRGFGAVAALWALAEELGLRDAIDAECGTRSGPGASIGTYLVLAAINRIVEARSKRGFSAWYQGTSLERLAEVAPDALTSQAFWTAMDRFPENAGKRVLPLRRAQGIQVRIGPPQAQAQT
jgi:hypothetical protein